MTILSLTSNSEKVVHTPASVKKKQRVTSDNQISQLCQDLIISDETNSSQKVKAKKQELADFFWKHLCEQVDNTPDLTTRNIRKSFFNFFPTYQPSIAATDSSQVVNLWLDFYAYNLNQNPPSSSLISLIFNKQLEDNLKDRIYSKIEKKKHENFLFAVLEKGEEGVQTLLRLDNFIKITPKQEKKWIEKFSTEIVDKEKWLVFCELGDLLQVSVKGSLFNSRLIGVVADRIYKTYPESIKEIAALPVWEEFFNHFNKKFEDLHLAVYREIYRNPYPNTFYLPPDNNPEFQSIYESIEQLFKELSFSPVNLFPKLRLNKQSIAAIGGNCFGAILQISKNVLTSQEEDLDSALEKIYSVYGQRVTREAFINQVAYTSIYRQQMYWYKLFTTIFQLLSSEDPKIRAVIIFLISVRYEISEEKVIYFLQTLTAPQEIEIIKDLSRRKHLFSLSSIKIFFKKGEVEENWLRQVVSEMGLPTNKAKFIKRTLVDFYALQQTKGKFNLQGIIPSKKILRVYRNVRDKYSFDVNFQLRYLDGLMKKNGVEVELEKEYEAGSDAENIEKWVQNIREGVYLFYLTLEAGGHAMGIIYKNDYFYIIDPNFEKIIKISPPSFLKALLSHCQNIYKLSLKDRQGSICVCKVKLLD